LVLGAGIGGGVVLMVDGWLRPARPVDAARAERTRRLVRSVLLAVAAAAVVAVVTGWPALTVGAALVGAAAPGLVERRRRGRLYELQRIEAMASWIEQLRDRLSASGGFQTTVGATVRIAPEPIRAEVGRLASGLANASPEETEAALMRFAAEVADPIADLVVVALWMWAQRRARHLDELLSTLARQARAEAAVALAVDAERAGLRRERSILTVLLVAVPVALTAVDPSYLAPFGSAGGQVVLSGVLAMYAAGLWLLARLARPQRSPRVLDTSRVFAR
jgi:tight adherence protein B